MKPHPSLVYGRVFVRAGYGSTRKRWAQAERSEKKGEATISVF